MSYHNTTNLQGEELKKAKRDALNQEESIIDIFEHLTFVYGKEQFLTPSRVASQWINPLRHRTYCPPITSIRRAITGLTKKGKLEKTNIMDEGRYGKLEHSWKLKLDYSNAIISNSAEQLS